MPKNNKKGKQKEVPTAVFAHPAAAAAPPPPPPPPPPPHPPPIMTIDTIEEEDDDYGEFGNMEEDDRHEDSWEQMHEAGDDLNDWAGQDLQNSNGGWAPDDGWGTSAPEPQAQMAPQPPPKDESHMKSQKKQHQHQQQQPLHQLQQQHHQLQDHQHHQHQHHHQPQPLQSDAGWGSGGGAWDNAGSKRTAAPAKHQNAKRSQTTQRAMEAPAWSSWGHEVGWGQGGDTEEIEEEEWSSAEDDPWGQAPTGWPQQGPVHPPQAHAQRQPAQQGGWQTWGEEARRLPKSQQPYHATNLPPGTGGYFHPQGADKQWSQQQAAMTAALRQQQEQAYALAQAQAKHQHQHQHQQQQQHPQLQQQQQHQHQHQHQQHDQNQFQQRQADALAQAQHRQAQLQQQQNHNQPQQEQAYALGLAHSLHRQPYQQQQYQHQPQHEGKNTKRNKENKHQHQSKKEKKHQQQQQENDAWGLGEGWQDLQDSDDEEVHDGWDRRVHFSPAHAAPSTVPSMVVEKFTVNAFPPNKLGLSTHGTPAVSSKTLAYAYHGTAAALNSGPTHNYMQDFADTQIVESHGAALAPVEGAFFSRNSRMAKDRFHWMFSPEKDPRVASLLAWIGDERVSYALGSLGLYKFLQTRERGALLVNVEYQSPDSPEPAFDWLTYPDLQKTKDRTLQESVAFYDPTVRVVVFVFLPSKSGNSLAIWRRKIDVPSNVRLAYQAQVTQVIATLNRDYVVHVDEIPQPSNAPPPPKKKRKWWKLWLSS